MKKLFFAAIAMVLALASCSSTVPAVTTAVTTSVTKSLEHMESSARVLEADHNMLLTPVIADLEVSDKKISYTEKEMFANYEVTHSLLSNLPELKKIALSRAARENNADVLLGATIDIVTNNGRLEITVSGYPAHYVKFRKAENKDVELLKNVYNIKTVDGSDIIDSPATKLNIKKTEKIKE